LGVKPLRNPGHPRFITGAAWLLFVLCLLDRPLTACDTPVFRYALERWHPGDFDLVLFHQGPLKAADGPLIQQLAGASKAGGGEANFKLEQVDVAASPADAMGAVWTRQHAVRMPWLVLRYPGSKAEEPDAWCGPLNSQTVRFFQSNPTAAKVAEEIGRGDRIPMLVFLSGHEAKDETFRRSLTLELKKLEQKVLVAESPQNTSKSNAVTVTFPMSIISRQNAEGRFLAQIVFNSDAELAQSREPILVPVFGRGRALCALPASRVNAAALEKIRDFLLGMCSCEVKDQNPGLDLMIHADWQAWSDRLTPPSGPALAGPSILENPVLAPATNSHPQPAGQRQIAGKRPQRPAAAPATEDRKIEVGQLGQRLMILTAAILGLVAVASWGLIHFGRRRN
jgi:hypothetical protein